MAYLPDRILNHSDRINSMLAGENIPPVNIQIHPTNLCDHACTWCYCVAARKSAPSAALSVQVISRVLQDAEALGVRSVVYSGGGEPCMHPQIDAIMSLPTPMSVGLITNGNKLNKVSDSGIRSASFIRVSLDAGTDDTYRQIRGKAASLKSVVKNMKRVAAVRNPTTTSLQATFSITETNVDELSTAAELVKDCGFDQIQFRPLCSVEDGFLYLEKVGLDDVASRFHNPGKFEVLFRRLSEQELAHPEGIRDFSVCRAHRFVSVVDASGDVDLCGNMRNMKLRAPAVFGNVNESSFADIWNGDLRRKIVKALESDQNFVNSKCPVCRMFEHNTVLDRAAAAGYDPTWRFV